MRWSGVDSARTVMSEQRERVNVAEDERQSRRALGGAGRVMHAALLVGGDEIMVMLKSERTRSSACAAMSHFARHSLMVPSVSAIAPGSERVGELGGFGVDCAVAPNLRGRRVAPARIRGKRLPTGGLRQASGQD